MEIILNALNKLNNFEDYNIDFYQKVTNNEIQDFELTQNIQLPESYKAFIQTYGLFTLRKDSDWYKLLTFKEAIKVKDDIIPHYETDPNWEFKERFEKLFYFQNNGWGATAYFAFDKLKKIDDTNEKAVISVDFEDEIRWEQQYVSFEEHIIRLVDALLNNNNTFFF